MCSFGSQGPADGGAAGTAGTKGQEVQRLQRRLKAAARSIVRLRLEKEQLQELGNRLRAERGRAGEPAPQRAPGLRRGRRRRGQTPPCGCGAGSGSGLFVTCALAAFAGKRASDTVPRLGLRHHA